MAINSRAKGANGERELAQYLRNKGHLEARRSAQYCGKTGDAPDIVGVDGLHIECKRVEQFRDDVSLQQAERDSRAGDLPIVMYRRNGEEWKALTRLDTFLIIWDELSDTQKANIHQKLKFLKNRS